MRVDVFGRQAACFKQKNAQGWAGVPCRTAVGVQGVADIRSLVMPLSSELTSSIPCLCQPPAVSWNVVKSVEAC